jgi:hypothetical protein
VEVARGGENRLGPQFFFAGTTFETLEAGYTKLIFLHSNLFKKHRKNYKFVS